jgi:uncharacterized protein
LDDKKLLQSLERIAVALEKMAPSDVEKSSITDAQAFVYNAQNNNLSPVHAIASIPLNLLIAIDRPRDTLLQNTLQFARGLPANNALLWGAKGMGKSSLVKAIHCHINQLSDFTLKLIEIHREDIASLPRLLTSLKGTKERIIIYCDDLSFNQPDRDFKALKSVLEGGLEARPDNILFYATSNRRHLIPRDMADNERSTAINPAEVIDETVALSDRFGLWLGFHTCSQDEYLTMVSGYVTMLALPLTQQDWQADALNWAITRGARSGRVAWQFVQDLAGKVVVEPLKT